MATAIEAIYRDLEYARSLIKRTHHDEAIQEAMDAAATRDQSSSSSSTPNRPLSGCSSSGRAPSEEWSVISDQDDSRDERRSSVSSSRSEAKADRSSTFKRSSLAAAVLSVLPDALTHNNPSTNFHHRSNSLSSHKT